MAGDRDNKYTHFPLRIWLVLQPPLDLLHLRRFYGSHIRRRGAVISPHFICSYLHPNSSFPSRFLTKLFQFLAMATLATILAVPALQFSPNSSFSVDRYLLNMHPAWRIGKLRKLDGLKPKARRFAVKWASGRITAAAAAAAVTANQTARFTQEGFESFLVNLQSSICDEAASADGSGQVFGMDKWQRGEDAYNGYGITRVLEGGDLLEKAAANVSIVRGHLSETRAKAMSSRGRGVDAGASYFAGALSLVFHPCSPMVPTFRSDIRYFVVEGSHGWFGGGADLTPSYLFEEDTRDFHTFYKAICDKYSSSLYEESKAACDKYFYIPARKEHRGTGGIFFDDLESFQITLGDQTKNKGGAGETDAAVTSFVKDVAEGFMPSFLPIANCRRTLAYGEAERQWQLLRRGRYLEFNLLYDRGVRFGLDGGRMESIMVSAPPLIAWKYNVVPEQGSREAELIKVLQKPRSWT